MELSRRQFLKVSGLMFLKEPFFHLPKIRAATGSGTGRVAGNAVFVFEAPDFQSTKVTRLEKDTILNLYYKVESAKGTNRTWYRIFQGYVHSAYIQRVATSTNPIPGTIPPSGIPACVTVPFSQAVRFQKESGWELIYRLYYGSVHWINGIDAGPDGSPCYRIEDSHQRQYFAAAQHFHLITTDEMAPLSVEIPGKEKWIEVSIANQSLRAFEGDQCVLDTQISSGVPQIGEVRTDEFPTDTPLGDFHITVKAISRHMGGTEMTNDLLTSALPGVPWVNFFHEDGYSCHGTYWHNNFGLRMSHGCVNMRTDQALWLYRWTEPVISSGERQVSGWGTRIRVLE